LGQWDEDREFLAGRIGFQAAGGVAEIWDEQATDFKEQELPAGTTSPFVVELGSLRIAFQLRPGVIARGSFSGALQGLLNEASAFDRWQVEPEFQRVSWDEWTASVTRITRFEVRLDRPNPNYHGRDHVEEMIEGVGSRTVRVIHEADLETLEGLDVDDDFITEAIDHAGEYGSWRAVGETEVAGETERVQWRSEAQGVAPERQIEADPRTREVDFEDMGRELREHEPPELQNRSRPELEGPSE